MLFKVSGAVLASISFFVTFPAVVQATDLQSVLAGQANLTTFRGLVKNHTDIFANLPKGVTVAAPNDNAFRKLGDWGTYNQSTVKATLQYHILTQSITMPSIIKGDSIWAPTTLTDPAFSNVTGGQHLILTKQPDGEVVFTSGFATRGTVLTEDLAFDNDGGGLVQVIDSVMRVPESLEATARAAYTDLTSFVGALYAADLMDELAGMRDVTLFAPHNAAFQQLAAALEGLDKASLQRVLRYHIVPNNVTHSWELKNASSLATWPSSSGSSGGGPDLTITRHTNFIYVNSAEIIQADILIANGVVHMVDNVLNPDRGDARPDVTGTVAAQPPVFTIVSGDAVPATGLAAPTPFVSDLPCTASCPPPTRAGGVGAAATGAGAPSKNGGGVAMPRCTGMAGVGVGVGFAVGAVVLGL